MSVTENKHGQATAQASGPNGQSEPIGAAAQHPDAGNIEKIRDILFGGQMRDYDRRFSRVEEQLIKESLNLREDTRKRFEGLEAFIKSEFAALSERLQAEQRTRDDAVQGLWRGVQELNQSLSGKLAELHDGTTRAQSDLRQQILDQSKALSDEIRSKQDEITAMLQREVADLTDAKTDRSALANLFTEMAMRLNNELKLPAGN